MQVFMFDDEIPKTAGCEQNRATALVLTLLAREKGDWYEDQAQQHPLVALP